MSDKETVMVFDEEGTVEIRRVSDKEIAVCTNRKLTNDELLLIYDLVIYFTKGEQDECI